MNLSWRDSGEVGVGDPLLFLHAFPLNQSMWDPQFSYFSNSRRVITLDWPGFGQSSLAETEEDGQGLDPYARSVIRLLDHLEIERATICGLSMGGYAALALYRLSPDRVASLILCDTRATGDSAEARAGRYETMERLSRRIDEGIEPLISSMVPRLLGDSTLSSNPGLRMKIEDMIRGNRAEGVIRGLRALAERPDSTDLLPLIGNREMGETLIIVGNEDKLTPPSEMRLMSAAISRSKFVIIEGAGHLPNLEQSEKFNHTLADFLA
jgi:3-oxoadipate enol-lactonase